MKNIALIGYSGHAFVAFEIFFSQGLIVSAYTDKEEKSLNPYSLKWLGDENDAEVVEKLKAYTYFVSIGDNTIRKKVSEQLIPIFGQAENALHKTAIISRSMNAGVGNMFAPRVVINPLVKIGNGVICNTGSIIEHECVIHDYAHIAPGAVLCGNVTVGEGSFVGANAVVKQGVTIGKNVIIGAGAVIIKDIEDNKKVVGNPQRFI
ncbi:MAG: acetyltransferase [Bacteroidetes bacterium]|nr:acetyltransferase [Bacteroidota bacterium]